MGWKRIEKRIFHVDYVDTDQFKGYITFLYMHKVKKPLWKEYSHWCTKIADTGFQWMQHFPTHSHYSLTTMLTPNGEIIQWYIDICREHGVTDDQIPWFDDLLLDIIILSTGKVELLDEDELEDAFHKKEITKFEYELAMREAHQILNYKNQYVQKWKGWITEHKKLWNDQKSALPIVTV